MIPEEISRFIAAQLGLRPDDLMRYASRGETRREHLATLRTIYGYRMFTGKHALAAKAWLAEQTEASRSSEDLVRRFVDECRRRQIILPGPSTIERLCADRRHRMICSLDYPKREQAGNAPVSQA